MFVCWLVGGERKGESDMVLGWRVKECVKEKGMKAWERNILNGDLRVVYTKRKEL